MFSATGTLLAITLVVTPAGAASPSANNTTSKTLRDAVTAAGVTEHLQAFQDIADTNGGTRVSGTRAYNLSADYAAQKFRDAGLTVTIQDFQFQNFITLSPTVLAQVTPPPAGPLENVVFKYSGSGDVTAPVSSAANLGCNPADFAGFPAGNIALILRGVCAYATKAMNAHNAGATGVVIYNNTAGPIDGTLSEGFAPDIPVTSITQATGQQLAATPGLVLRLTASTFRGLSTTRNVFAETKTGDPANVVMIGAHLDSVNAGPGINDNGSGSATLLEIAEQMAKVKPTNRVRFALWGAEESGLIGSNYYMGLLSPAERQKIALYLNFDMIASPNYGRFVYDGDGSAFGLVGPTGSDAIEAAFHDYFGGASLTSAQTAFSGRSDYAAFSANGIPAGGLFTGAEGVKNAAQAAAFGGTAGIAFDPCYHQACDTIANVNQRALEEMADAASHVLLTFAFDTSAVNGKGNGRPVSPPGRGRPGTPIDDSSSLGGGLHEHDDHELTS
jgi:aminopeptidase Y